MNLDGFVETATAIKIVTTIHSSGESKEIPSTARPKGVAELAAAILAFVSLRASSMLDAALGRKSGVDSATPMVSAVPKTRGENDVAVTNRPETVFFHGVD